MWALDGLFLESLFFPFVSTQKKIRGTLLEKKGGSKGGSVYWEKKRIRKGKLEKKSFTEIFQRRALRPEKKKTLP
jgi:hypothetical protein